MWQKLLAVVLLAGVVLLAVAVSQDATVAANLRSLVIVLGGSFLGALIAYPIGRFKELFQVLRAAFRTGPGRAEAYLDAIIKLSRLARSQGIRGLEAAVKKLPPDFLRLGLELLADGRSRQDVAEALEKEFDRHLAQRESLVSLLQTLARLAPAFGLAGTLIGLIRMFSQMSDATSLGLGMSLALLTTFYGILLANLVLLPLSRKLKEFTRQEALVMALIMDGVLGLADNEHPLALAHRLETLYLTRRRPVFGSTGESAGPAVDLIRRRVREA